MSIHERVGSERLRDERRARVRAVIMSCRGNSGDVDSADFTMRCRIAKLPTCSAARS
jgi:hypothetical protein